MKSTKSKIVLISLLFLIIFILENPSSDLPSNNKKNELLVRSSAVDVEGILNVKNGTIKQKHTKLDHLLLMSKGY